MLHLIIVIPERELFAEDVDSVLLPGAEGQLGILPNHAPMIVQLDEGTLTARRANEVYQFAIHGGFAKISASEVSVLAHSAEQAGAIDVQRAEQARQRALEKLHAPHLSPEDRRKAEEHLHRAETRLHIAQQRSRNVPPRYDVDATHK